MTGKDFRDRASAVVLFADKGDEAARGTATNVAVSATDRASTMNRRRTFGLGEFVGDDIARSFEGAKLSAAGADLGIKCAKSCS